MTKAPGIMLKGQHRIGDRVLFDTDLQIPAAQWTCLLGRSGVGKSTILRLILDLETGGTFNGSIAATDGMPLAGRISYMAQSDLLLPWLSVLDNVCIGARLRGTAPNIGRARDLLHRVHEFVVENPAVVWTRYRPEFETAVLDFERLDLLGALSEQSSCLSGLSSAETSRSGGVARF